MWDRSVQDRKMKCQTIKRIKTLESEEIEVICLEANIAKRKWAIFNIYRPSCKSMDLFFNELSKLIDLAINKY